MIQNKNLVKKNRTIKIITDNCICCGCGGCLPSCPEQCIQFEYGNRYNFPIIDEDKCTNCGVCLKVCPSEFLLHGKKPDFPILTEADQWQDCDCYLLHSPDDDIRMNSSSGGFITALIAHLVETGQVDGGIVAHCSGKNPLIAESVIATDRASLINAQASKYAPVSSCTVLAEVLQKPGRYAFVGVPCMIESLYQLQKIKRVLRERIVLSIGMVCAGMASRMGTQLYIENEGKVNLKDVRRIAYRGGGWPGRFRVFGDNKKILMDRPLIGPLERGSLHHVVPYDHYLRCWNCVDHWGRFSDIVVSDPWTEKMVQEERKGRSGILIRNEKGKKAVESAIKSGALVAERISPDEMLSYNKHLIINKKHPRHSWMALYQLLFFKRLSWRLFSVLWGIIRKREIGLLTTLRARFNKKYYY